MIKGKIDKVFFNNGSFFIFSIEKDNYQRFNLKGKVSKEDIEKIKKGNLIETTGKAVFNEKYGDEIKINEENIKIIEVENEKESKDVIEGEICNIIYQSEGFNIFDVKNKKTKEKIRCKSHSTVFMGFEMKLHGFYKKDNYGLSFNVEKSEELPFSNEKALISFLSSKFFKGIGKHYATKIVKMLGMKALDILKENPKELLRVKGIGKKRVDSITKSFSENMKIKEIIQFAVEYKISEKMIFKLYNKYGNNLINLLHQNPYLITELNGIGFKKADEIAEKIGIEKDSKYRINSFVAYYLLENSDGNTFFKLKDVIGETEKNLGFENGFEKIIDAYFNFEEIEYQVKEGETIITKKLTKDVILFNLKELFEIKFAEELKEKEELCIATKHNYYKELKIFKKLKKINRKEPAVFIKDGEIEEMIKEKEIDQGFKYADMQKEILRQSIKHKLLVLTGKAGTGKSTVSKGIIEMYEKTNKKVLNLAPTGKAAKRIMEVANKKAHTIHSACFNLEFENFDVIIVDEAGMLSTFVANMLMEKVQENHTLVLIGDVAQIPPVQDGNIFRDTINLIKTNMIKGCFVELNEIKRQDKDSNIAAVCNKIADGVNPGKIDYPDIKSFAQIDENLIDSIVKIIKEEMNNYKVDFNQIQIISPQYNGIVGINAINERIQEVFNKNKVLLNTKKFKIKKKDKVMQNINNKELNIVNGDTLEVLSIEEKDSKDKNFQLEGKSNKEKVVVCKLNNGFENRVFDYPLEEFIKYTNLAYCCSAHKMQGSEYPIVIYVLSTSHFIMLNRNLLYTGLTRGKEKVHLIGQKKAFDIALNNEVNQTRDTILQLINKYEISEI